jgi:hypothetical protein
MASNVGLGISIDNRYDWKGMPEEVEGVNSIGAYV